MQLDEALLGLLQDSLTRGHWRVASRRYLMLDACRAEVPHPLRVNCERLLLKCSERELRRMQVDAARWARMCAPVPFWKLPTAAARRAPAAQAAILNPGAVRTQWRPLPSFP